MIRKALQAEEERKRIGRENFQMTTVPVPQLAADEPALHHATDEHEEGIYVSHNSSNTFKFKSHGYSPWYLIILCEMYKYVEV